MTGTPLDLTPFGAVLGAIGWLFWLLVLVLLVAAWWLPKVLWQKIAAVLIVIAGFYAVIVRPLQAELSQQQAAKSRLDESMALFRKRCESAGEKVYRTVENVDGILLLKIRQHGGDESDPMMPGAAAAHEFYGKDYISSFLLFEREQKSRQARALIQDLTRSSLPGYRFVEAVDPVDHRRYRYTVGRDLRVGRVEATGPSPRYGVTFEEIVNPEERKHWVAGSTVKVVDLQTQEVIGEFIRYVIDPGQGSKAGQRSPWLLAEGCGMKTSYGSYSTRLFVDQVLKPAGGN